MAKTLSRARSSKPKAPGYSLESYGEARKEFVRSMFLQHWERVRQAIDLIEGAGDIGIVSQSLRRMCEAIEPEPIERDYLVAYDLGDAGDWRNDELEVALGLSGLEIEFADRCRLATES